MDVEKLREKLLAAAKNIPGNEEVPYAFSRRVMAHIGRAAPLNAWSLWGRPLWSAAASCLAITVLCALWSFAAEHRGDSPESFSQEFEQTVLSPVNQHFEDAW